jgi:hypothetical protein
MATPTTSLRRLVTVVAVPAALVLTAAACSDDDGTVAAGSDGGSGDLTISIAEPADGSTVEPGFAVEVDPGVEIGEPDTGRHHVHIYYDGNRSDGEYDIVYDADEPWTVERDLPPGTHTVEAFIANADHSLTEASDEITVTVGEAADGGGADDPGSDDGGSGGYGY